jgi:hypothetical protein
MLKFTRSNYQVEFLGVCINDGKSTFCYKVTRFSNSQQLSHLTIGVCDDCGSPQQVNQSNFVSSCPPGATLGTDGSTGIYGIKWDSNVLPNISVGQSKTFCFTLNRTDYVIGPVQAIPKAGSNKQTNTICGVSCATLPTAADLHSFKATRIEDGKVVLYWETGYEVDNLGFNIYRDDGGKITKVTPELVAGSALLAGPGTALTAGKSYVWSDALPVTDSVQYWVEDIDLNGTAKWNGPYAVENASAEIEPGKNGSEPLLLSKIGDPVKSSSELTSKIERKAPMAEATAEELISSKDATAGSAVKLSIKQEGWYRVTQAQLTAAGFGSNVNPLNLQLFVDGRQIPCVVTGDKDGRFDAGDAVEFYGMGIESPYTDTRTYYLTAGSEAGMRISQTKGMGPKVSGSFNHTVERRDRTIYFSSLLNGEVENFFGAVVVRQPLAQTINLTGVDRVFAGDATVQIALQGISAMPHRVNVSVNGRPLGEINFQGRNQGTAGIGVPQRILVEGTNTITLTPLGGDSDSSLVDYIRLTYRRKFSAVGNALTFRLSGKSQVTVGGFSNSGVRVYDVTDSNAIQQLASAVKGDNAGGFTVTTGSPASGERVLLAFTDDAVKQPFAILSEKASSLADQDNAADMVIISHPNFVEAMNTLRSWREAQQNLSVKVIDVEDVYDEFNFGHKSPRAIRDFLVHAKDNWKTPPRFALLVGDATYDPKNYLGGGNNDLVPTKLTETSQFETANDGWFSDFDGDGVPEIAIGRFSVRTLWEAAAMVAKTIAYDQSQPGEGSLLVSDANSADGYNFEAVTAALAATLPEGYPVEQIRRGQDPNAKASLISALNSGPKVVNYSGHGSATSWRSNLFTNNDAAALTNTNKHSIYIAMSCLNGLFHDHSVESLAEKLMKSQGGAIAVFASSSITEPTEQGRMNHELFRQLFGDESITVGEAMVKAKSVARDADVRQTWNLFGDPTIRMR